MYLNINDGLGYSTSQLRQVWQKGKIVSGYNPDFVRKDWCGALIEWKQHGNTNSKYGWEVDHIKPQALGGSNNLSNLQPLQWENNRSKGVNYPRWTCKVR